ncbi:Unknown protein [Striga hermonthica]|uniref:Uncharacterized protein n=1 Tax=Striga hermonthica TaxID=68872 RepID=A0A9N7NSB3_STRHE|nr:Unknown protein [Striga hermonthica]
MANHSNSKSVNHDPDEFYYLKMALQVLFSLSTLSFLFYHPSQLAPFFVQAYDYFSSNFSIKVFTCTTERNFIFLICNGILVLIIRTSGLAGKIAPVKISPKDVSTDVCNMEEVDEAKGANGAMKVEVLEVKGSDRVEKGVDPGLEIENREIDHEAREEEDPDENDDEQLSKIAPVKISTNDVGIDACKFDETKGANGVMKVEVLEVKGSDRVEKGGIFDPGLEIENREIDHEAREEEEEDDDDDDDDDENDDEQLSIDELNKKCEDFIKRVKQEIQGV